MYRVNLVVYQVADLFKCYKSTSKACICLEVLLSNASTVISLYTKINYLNIASWPLKTLVGVILQSAAVARTTGLLHDQS